MGRLKKEIVLYKMGLEYYKQQDLHSAFDCFSKATERNPRFSKAWIFKGSILYLLEKYSESIECYERAIEINSRNSYAWANRGQSLIKLGKFEEALESANKAIERASLNANAWGIKGDALVGFKNYDEAIKCYEKAIEIYPKDIWSWISKGEVLYSLGNLDGAITCFDTALDIDAEIPEAWLNKGKILCKQGKKQESLNHINKAIELDPQNGDFYHIKSILFSSMGKVEEAKECIDKAKSRGYLSNRKSSTEDRNGSGKKVKFEESTKKHNEDSNENTLHEEIQWSLLKLGSGMGLNVWVARNDKGREVNGCRFIDVQGLINELPRQFDPSTNRIIELIDVLWLKDNAIIAAFEIESTTSIYSGLLRMSDLISMQPNLNIPLYIVAPDERRAKVISEINRPTFSKLSQPLNKICMYIPISRLKENIAQHEGLFRYLKPEYIKEMAECCIPEIKESFS